MNERHQHAYVPRYIILPVVLAVVLLILAVRGLDWRQVAETVRHARLSYLGAAFALVSLSFFIRGLRWGILLSAERTLAPMTLFWATALGYLGNNILPARAGELIRSLSLAYKTTISVGYVLATALTERIFDALALVIISFAAISTLRDMPGSLIIATRTMAAVGLVGTVAVFAAPHMTHLAGRILGWLPLPAHLHDRLWALVEQFLLGMRACHHVGRAVSFAAITVLAWSIDTVMAIQVGRALGLSLSITESLLLLAALGLSSAIPSTPGYIGVYQFVSVLVFTRYGYSRHEALTYIVAFQAVTVLASLVYGTIGMWQLNARQFLSARRLSPPSDSRV